MIPHCLDPNILLPQLGFVLPGSASCEAAAGDGFQAMLLLPSMLLPLLLVLLAGLFLLNRYRRRQGGEPQTPTNL